MFEITARCLYIYRWAPIEYFQWTTKQSDNKIGNRNWSDLNFFFFIQVFFFRVHVPFNGFEMKFKIEHNLNENELEEDIEWNTFIRFEIWNCLKHYLVLFVCDGLSYYYFYALFSMFQHYFAFKIWYIFHFVRWPYGISSGCHLIEIRIEWILLE